MCWHGILGVRGKKVLNDVVNMCSKVVGQRQACIQDVYEQKARQIIGDQSLALKFYHQVADYRTVKGKARLLKTFIPCSLHLLNS